VRPFAVLAGLPVRLDDRIRERVLSQALARPGTLVVADSTRRQLGTLFEIEDLGPPISLADAAARRSRIAAG
jgi:class 3 adenylate cyclase